MIIKNFDLNKKNIINNKLFLFHGENEGYKNQIIKELFLENNEYKKMQYDEAEIIENYEKFIEDQINQSLFEEKKIIIIYRSSDKLIRLVEELTSRKLNDNIIILISEILQKKSKIRNFFEKEKNLVCVPFYQDTNKTLSTIANNFFKDKKIKVSQQIINILADRSLGDRKNLSIELNKIESYCSDKKSISYDEILKLTNLSENYSAVELVDSCLSKNINRTIYILNENNYSHEDCILILRTFLYRCKRLLKIKEIISESKDIEFAISEFRPPIFWKEKETIKIQNFCWTTKTIQNLISEIYQLEVSIKKNVINSLNILSDFILNKAKKI